MTKAIRWPSGDQAGELDARLGVGDL